jgi:hypothetical protein
MKASLSSTRRPEPRTRPGSPRRGRRLERRTGRRVVRAAGDSGGRNRRLGRSRFRARRSRRSDIGAFSGGYIYKAEFARAPTYATRKKQRSSPAQTSRATSFGVPLLLRQLLMGDHLFLGSFRSSARIGHRSITYAQHLVDLVRRITAWEKLDCRYVCSEEHARRLSSAPVAFGQRSDLFFRSTESTRRHPRDYRPLDISQRSHCRRDQSLRHVVRRYRESASDMTLICSLD